MASLAIKTAWAVPHGFTLSAGIESAICSEIDEIEHVVDVTDHESGQEPFYKD